MRVPAMCYRLLNEGEIIEASDEEWHDTYWDDTGCEWLPVGQLQKPGEVKRGESPVRRKLSDGRE